jgi:hypothetical protein
MARGRIDLVVTDLQIPNGDGLNFAVEQGIAVLGMKSKGDGNVLKSGRVTPMECLHYALNLPVSVVITGCERMAVLDQAIEAAQRFTPHESGGRFGVARQDEGRGHDGAI